MKVEAERDGNVGVLSPPGNLVARGEVAELEQAIDNCDRDGLNVVVDLGQVEYLSSIALAALGARLGPMRAQGRDLKLVNASKHVCRVLDAAGLATQIQVCADVVTALTTFGKGVGEVERRLLNQ